MKKPLQVMKFGGTSVGDASCIARVAQIVRDASRQGPVVVVVSAMSGVTNRLVAASARAEAGNREQVAELFGELRKQHEIALSALVPQSDKRSRLAASMEDIFREGERLCEGTVLLRELTPRTLDSVSSLGERLSAPMVSGAIAYLGVPSEAIEATDLVVTDAYHGGAEPLMDRTRERCEARLRPLLDR
jgi:bifunctional aspartokinase / homoserine dehydrogenase 1